MTRIKRKNTRVLHIGDVPIGGGHPIAVQSMTNTPTHDLSATLDQMNRLKEAGCDVVRVAVADFDDACVLKKLVKAAPMPVVADIHFDYKLALEAIKGQVHGLRLNPGNIGAAWKVKEVVQAARERSVPIRIGVNAGSLEPEILRRYGGPSPEAMVESAMIHVRILEALDYPFMKLSLKASRVPLMLEAYRQISTLVDYPLHLGVTEAGLPEYGLVKSAVGVGALLSEGIGDTVRISLTGDPVEEVVLARQILQSLELAEVGLEIISCPTCGRTQVKLAQHARALYEALEREPELKRKALTVAVMGCVVNGPGEAREADLGVACGKGSAVLFAKGKPLGKIREEEIVPSLLDLIRQHPDN